MLTHQSGIPEINRGSDTSGIRLLNDGDRLALSMKIDSLQFTPGTKCEYSNTGYSILAEVVSKVSGMPFQEYMRREIFSPIGMGTTSYYPNTESRNVGYRI